MRHKPRMKVGYSVHQSNLVNPLCLRIRLEGAIDVLHHSPQRSGLLVCHFSVIEKMPFGLDEQCPQRSQLTGRVTDHPVLIFTNIAAGWRGFLSLMLTAGETIVHHSCLVIYELPITFYNPSHV